MKIVCGVENSDLPVGCPMTFSLYGSNETYQNFQLIMSHDSYDYNIHNYSQSGQMFTFFKHFNLDVQLILDVVLVIVRLNINVLLMVLIILVNQCIVQKKVNVVNLNLVHPVNINQ